jgi:hypothetical protein
MWLSTPNMVALMQVASALLNLLAMLNVGGLYYVFCTHLHNHNDMQRTH